MPVAVGTLVRGALYYGSAALAGWWGANNWVNDPEANKEWQDYKDRYKAPPPPGLDECELLKWKLEREKRLLQDRKAWDAKWNPGRHDDAIAQTENAIKNLERKIKNRCKDQYQ